MSRPRPPLRHASSSTTPAPSVPGLPTVPDPSPGTSTGGSTPTPRHGDAVLPLLAEVRVFVVPAKMPPRVFAYVDALGGERVMHPSEARFVITALRGRPRLARVLGSELDRCTLLEPGFVEDTYAAATVTGAQWGPLGWEKYVVRVRRASVEVVDDGGGTGARGHRGEDVGDADIAHKGARKRGVSIDDEDEVEPLAKRARRTDVDDESEPPGDVTPYPEDMRLRDIPRMACERPSPLKCVNQDIIDAIKPIYLEREFDDWAQKNTNVLSYRRSMSALKSVPRRLRSGKEALKVIDVGEKVAVRIDEYLTTGTVAESAAILASDRYRALQEFSSIHTIGHATAAELWKAGCRNLDDVRAYFYQEEEAGRRGARKREQRRMDGGMSKSEIVEAWLGLKDELATPIPRDEVLEIAELVRDNLDLLSPGCKQTICGGFRRGKPDPGDVDIIFCPPTPGTETELLRRLYRRLARLGIVTHVLQITFRDPISPLHASGANFDNLDKAFVIFRLPAAPRSGDGDDKTPRMRIHRRVDFICAPPERYAAAVLSWSGSMMFERDLRRVAEEKGYKFRAGLIEIATDTEVNFDTEREIFAFLGLRYVPPELRNADG